MFHNQPDDRLSAAARRRIVEDFHQRDEIETAMNGVSAADSDAYFYAGMAWGITLACMPGGQ